MGFNVKQAGAAKSGADKEFKALPAGRYNLRVEDTAISTSGNGNTVINVSFVVIDGAFANRKAWHNFTLTDKALPFVAKFLIECGSDVAEEEDVSAEEIAQDIIGKVVSAYTEPGTTNNGNPRNELKNWKAVDGAEGAVDNSDELFS